VVHASPAFVLAGCAVSVGSGLILSGVELERVKRQLSRYPWYRGVLEGFRARVEELISRSPAIPLLKGRAFYESCPVDHARLSFDPFAPRSHVCPKCGRAWLGEVYDLAWVRQFQEWHAKRLVEAGILFAVEEGERHARLVRDALVHFVRHYRDYPLANNLLGPTRLFQSTFLEAFWLVDMVAAYDLTRSSSVYSPADHEGVRELFYESVGVVRSFDEGVSNRQAFSNAGMGAVALLYHDEALVGHVLQGPHGFAFHMRESLLEDGIWYEGETYHFATLDHLLDLAEMARHRGIDLYRGESGFGSLEVMFEGPLKVMLPDLTFPSRKDSWYGRGIGYHRDVYELGYSRYGNERYGGLLAHAYANGGDRSDITWRTFLHLQPELPRVHPSDLHSSECEAMPGTGVAVLRRGKGNVYASLEYGHYGGGHGHPDRLHLSLYAHGVHWLLDPGTGWYHVPELGWYRSTLAHNTVSVDGGSQNEAEGELQAFGSAGDYAAAQATVAGAYPGASLRRTLVLGDGFLLDSFEVDSDVKHDIDWSCHLRGEVRLAGSEARPIERLASRGGHPFLTHLNELTTTSADERAPVAGSTPAHRGMAKRAHGDVASSAQGGVILDATACDGEARLRVLQSSGDRLFRAEAMGVPLQEERQFTTLISRRRGSRAHFATSWSWGDAAEDIVDTAGPAAGEAAALRLAGREHRLILDGQPGLAVVSQEGGALREVTWFNRRKVDDSSIQVECDRPLTQASLRWEDDRLLVELPDDFGSVRVTGSALPPIGSVSGLPTGAQWSEDGGTLTLSQPPGTSVWVLSGGGPLTVAAGMLNELRFTVADYHAGSRWPRLEVPRGWELGRLERAGEQGSAGQGSEERGSAEQGSEGHGLKEHGLKMQPHLATWAAQLKVPGDAGPGELLVTVGESRTALAFAVAPPVRLDWSVDAEGGRPMLSLRVTESAGRAGRVWGEIHAPWLTAAAHPFVLLLEPGEERLVRVPLPRSPVPPTAPEPEDRLGGNRARPLTTAGSGGASDDNAGEYHVAALVRRDGFSGLSRSRFPLAWCLRRDEDTVAGQAEASLTGAGKRPGGLRVDRAEQAYWAELPWSGPEGASAEATLTWDERGLYLRCRVSDDRHVSDANDEDLYENDSLQLYLDFRPPARRDSTFAPGVAALILAPGQAFEAVRIEGIAGSRELANRGLAASWFTSEGVEAAVTRVAVGDGGEYRGYLLEAFLPYASLGIEPLRDGSVFRADLSLSDNDGNWYRTHQLVWSGARGDRRCYLRWAYLDPAEYGWILVVDPKQESSV
jgi:hypothetical protein